MRHVRQAALTLAVALGMAVALWGLVGMVLLLALALVWPASLMVAVQAHPWVTVTTLVALVVTTTAALWLTLWADLHGAW